MHIIYNYICNPCFFFQVFNMAVIWLSLDGEKFQTSPVRFRPKLETFKDLAAFNISIPLQNRVGRFVKIQLYFSACRIFLSEVSFDSGKNLFTF